MRNCPTLIVGCLTCSAFLHLASDSACAGRPEYDLRYRFEPSEVTYTQLNIETTSRESTTSARAGRQRTIKLRMMFEVQVASVDLESGATLGLTLRAARSEFGDNSSRSVIRDSHSRRPSPDDQILRDLVGQSALVQVGPDGSIKSAQGLEVIGKVMTAHLDSDDVQDQLAKTISQALSDQMLARSLGSGLRFLPGHPVAPGDTWDSNFDQQLPMIGSAQMEWTHRLTRVRRTRGSTVATIASDLDLELATAPAGLPLGGLISLDAGQATGRGETLFDIDRGRAMRSELEIELPILVSMPDLDTLEMRSMRQVIRTSMTHEIIEERDVPSLPE
jgi:hypothetical protein